MQAVQIDNKYNLVLEVVNFASQRHTNSMVLTNDNALCRLLVTNAGIGLGEGEIHREDTHVPCKRQLIKQILGYQNTKV